MTNLSDEEIRRADTGSYVFISLGGHIVDAMEDFKIVLSLTNR